MPNSNFELGISFPVTGLDNIDKANAKLDELSKKVDGVVAKIGQIGSSAAKQAMQLSGAMNQASHSASMAAQQAAKNAASVTISAATRSQQAYQQLLQTIQQTNAAMRNTPRTTGVRGGGGTGAGGGQGGGGGQPGGGGGGGNFIPGFANPMSGMMMMLGLGTGANAGFAALKQIGGFLKDLLPDAAAAARGLQNVSLEMGMTVQQTYQLQTAAKLAGVDLGTMSMAAKKLAEAIEDPGNAGKTTAKALATLGVSLHENLGDALKDAISKLAAIEDPTKRAQMAFEAFGRTGNIFLTLANNLHESQDAMKRWGLGVDSDVQEKLAHANTELEAFSAKLTLLKAKAAEGIILPLIMGISKGADTAQQITSATVGMGMLGAGSLQEMMHAMMFGVDPGAPKTRPNHPGVPGFGLPTVASEAAARSGQALLKDGSKRSIEEQLAEARSKLSTAEARLGSDTTLVLNHGDKAPTSDIYAHEKKDVQDLRAEVEKLEAAKKAAGKVDLYPEKLAEWKDKADQIINGNKGVVAGMDDTFNKQLRELGVKSKLSNGAWNPRFLDISDQFGIVRDNAIAQQREKERDRQLKEQQQKSDIDQITQKNIYGMHAPDPIFGHDASNDPTNPFYGMLHPQPNLVPGFSSAQMGRLGLMATRSRNRIASTTSQAGQEGQTAADELNASLREIEAFQREQIKNIEETKTGAERIKALEEQRFESVKSGLEATIQYEERLAEVRQRQTEETKSFVSGFFESVISGRPGAGKNFLSGYAHKYADTIIGNIGAASIGTMESRLTFQHGLDKPGVLGAPDANGKFQTNWFGRMLSGTPFGVDTSKGGHVDKLKDQTPSNVLDPSNKIPDPDALLHGIKQSGNTVATAIQQSTKDLAPAKPNDTGAAGSPDILGGSGAMAPAPKPVSVVHSAEPNNPLKGIDDLVASLAAPTSIPLPEPIRTTATDHPGDTPGQPSQPQAKLPATDDHKSWLNKIFGGSGNAARAAAPASSENHQATLQESIQKLTSNVDSNITALNANTALLKDLAALMGRATGVDAASMPGMSSETAAAGATGKQDSKSAGSIIANIAAPITSGVLGLGRAIQGGNAGGALDAINKIVGGIGGTSGFTGKVNLSSKSAPTGSGGGDPIPVTIEGANNNLPIAQGPQISLPNLGDFGGSGLPIAGIPITLPGLDAPSSGRAPNVGYNPANDQTAEQVAKTTTSIAGKLGSLFKRDGTYKNGSSSTLHGAVMGTDSNGNDIDGKERVGDALLAGAQIAGGVMAAKDGFSKGGARGDLQGIAGVGMAVAPFTGPAAPFVEAGSALLGMVGSLFPDRRQQRLDQEQKRVTESAFIQPAGRAYNFSTGSGESQGFGLGMGSSLTSGGQAANYSFTIQAMDAGNMLDYFNKNHQVFSQAMLYALANGGNTALNAEIDWRNQHQGIFG